jgi:hypothetical protein
VAAVGLLRRLSLRDAVPAFTLALTQALWFSIPFVVRYFGWRTGIAPLDQSQVMRDYVLWIFVGHGVQYLWITSFYARRSQGAPGLPAYLGKAVIAGVALWTLPFVLFAPGFLGRLDFDMGMAALVASAVNIHHFILDGAIWKLRNLRIANVLIRSQVEAPTAPTPRAGWARPLVWTTATVGLAIGVFELFETRVAYPDALARGNLDRAALALDHLAWVGYERADLRARLGSAYARSGQIDAAAGQYEQSLALAPTARVWTALGQLDERRQRIGDARRAYERALAAGPDRPDGIHAGIARVARLQGDGAAAIGHLREALRLNPGAPAHANDLAWTLATTPDPRLREPDEAIRLARSVVEAGSRSTASASPSSTGRTGAEPGPGSGEDADGWGRSTQRSRPRGPSGPGQPRPSGSAPRGRGRAGTRGRDPPRGGARSRRRGRRAPAGSARPRARRARRRRARGRRRARRRRRPGRAAAP